MAECEEFRPRGRRRNVGYGWGLLVGWFGLSLGCNLGPIAPPPPPPEDCSEISELFFAVDVLDDADHACFDWLDSVHGRVAMNSSASAVLWTRQTEAGTGVLVSALHTLGVGFVGPGLTDLSETLRDPSDEFGVARITLIDKEGRDSDTHVSPMFLFYNPSIPAIENANSLRDILPVHDFFLAVVDSQRLEREPLLEVPGPLNDEPPVIYDPGMFTTTSPTFADADPGELVMIVGYPAASGFNGAMAAGVGRVLSDAEAIDAITALATAGDEEGGIAYDAEVEMMIEGPAAGGMSGGGIFNEEGTLLGVLVRASEAESLPQYVRAVRMTYIVSEVSDALTSLAAPQREAPERYLESPN